MATYNSFKRITGEAIVDDSITVGDVATDAVATSNIAPNAVETSDINDGAVDTNKLASSLDISGKTVTYRSIVNNDFNNSAITGSKLASGAAVDNLGFTPINRAGDAMTGDLVMQDGQLIRSGNSNSGIVFSGATISLREGGTNRLYYDSSGRPVESAKPAWMASGRGGWRYGNSYGGAWSWRELDDMGWNYSTQGGITTSNNCRVTVPTAGYYYCYLQTYWYNDSNSTNGYTHWNIALNGGNGQMVTGRTPHSMYAYGLRNNYAPGIMVAYVRYLNAGQYVTPRPYFGGNQGRHHGNHSLWAGYMVG